MPLSICLHKTATMSTNLQFLIYKLNESVVVTNWSTNNKLGTKKVWRDRTYQKLELITEHRCVIKRARNISNVLGEVHFKQKQRLTIVFTGWNTLPHRKQSCKDAEYFIVYKIACHQHATVPKMNSPMAHPCK